MESRVIEKSADPLDAAAQQADMLLAQSISEVINRDKPIPTLECEECGDEIPLERQQASGGTNMCVHCKSIEEMREKNIRR